MKRSSFFLEELFSRILIKIGTIKNSSNRPMTLKIIRGTKKVSFRQKFFDLFCVTDHSALVLVHDFKKQGTNFFFSIQITFIFVRKWEKPETYLNIKISFEKSAKNVSDAEKPNGGIPNESLEVRKARSTVGWTPGPCYRWWSTGQCPRLLLRQSKFESQCLL